MGDRRLRTVGGTLRGRPASLGDLVVEAAERRFSVSEERVPAESPA